MIADVDTVRKALDKFPVRDRFERVLLSEALAALDRLAAAESEAAELRGAEACAVEMEHRYLRERERAEKINAVRKAAEAQRDTYEKALHGVERAQLFTDEAQHIARDALAAVAPAEEPTA